MLAVAGDAVISLGSLLTKGMGSQNNRCQVADAERSETRQICWGMAARRADMQTAMKMPNRAQRPGARRTEQSTRFKQSRKAAQRFRVSASNKMPQSLPFQTWTPLTDGKPRFPSPPLYTVAVLSGLSPDGPKFLIQVMLHWGRIYIYRARGPEAPS